MKKSFVVCVALLALTVTALASESRRVEVLEQSDREMNRGAFRLFRQSLCDALREEGFQAVTSRATIAERTQAAKQDADFYVDIVSAERGSVIANQASVATGPTGASLVTTWGGTASVAVDVYDGRTRALVKTYRLSGTETGLLPLSSGSGSSGGVSRWGAGSGRRGDFLTGAIAGVLWGHARSHDAARAVSRDVAIRMARELRDR